MKGFARGLAFKQKHRVSRTRPIAVIEVIGGLTYKRSERVNSALYKPFRL